jgi:hypothetical protein
MLQEKKIIEGGTQTARFSASSWRRNWPMRFQLANVRVTSSKGVDSKEIGTLISVNRTQPRPSPKEDYVSAAVALGSNLIG